MPDHDDFGIGIGQPGRQRRRRCVDEKACQDQVAWQRVGRHGGEVDGAGCCNLCGNARHQQHATEKMHQRVAQAGSLREWSPAPHDHRGADRHQLPEEEEGDEIAGQGDADGAAGIDERGGKLRRARLVEREQATRKGHDGEHRPEQARKLVALDGGEFVAEERDLKGRPVRDRPDERKRQERQRDQRDRAQPAAQQRQHHTAGDQVQDREG